MRACEPREVGMREWELHEAECLLCLPGGSVEASSRIGLGRPVRKQLVLLGGARVASAAGWHSQHVMEGWND
jgi:hypothetical protein